MKIRAAVALLLLAAIAAIAYQVRALHRPAEAQSLTTYVPQDALLTIESPDFSSLLHQWSNSTESKTWLASDNYSIFQNSRLFGRLTDAQTAFATAAGIPAGADLLNEVAGKQSVFAWYDIGKLEFLYITRMPASQAMQSQLLQASAKFQRRHAGNVDFYIRTSSGDYSTVAFAQVSTPSGDLLLLSTREDLMANALALVSASPPANSVIQEPWFHDASAALPPEQTAPSLHMVLNLDLIAVDPHFESYWIQRNITWIRRFRTAASDLYLEPTRFREERVLLPKSPEPDTANIPDIVALADLVPQPTGVFRVVATQDSSVAVTAIQEKLLGIYTAPPSNAEDSPDPSLAPPRSGSADDLETRIDTPPPVSSGASFEGLTQVFRSANLDAVLSLSSAQPPPKKDGLWVPIYSAVVLHTANPANPQALASALQQALRGSLTTANIGIGLEPSDEAAQEIYTITGPRPLLFAMSSTPMHGNLILLSDDKLLLLELLRNLATSHPEKAVAPASLIAVFNHTSQRAPFVRLTSLLDGTNNHAHDLRATVAADPNFNAGAPAPPTFFSNNMRSLSDSFAPLESERVVERTVDLNLRQTVTYNWKNP